MEFDRRNQHGPTPGLVQSRSSRLCTPRACGAPLHPRNPRCAEIDMIELHASATTVRQVERLTYSGRAFSNP